MKFKKYIISILITAAIIGIVIVRLASNKQSFNEELKMVSESITTIPVITDTVKYQQMATDFSVNGTFTAFREISVAAETQGKITSLRSDVGDKVVAGQVMASINNEIFASQLQLAKFNLEKAEKNRKRFEQLSKDDGATVQQYESAKQDFETAQSAYTTAKVDFENASVKAPFNGIVTKRYVSNGAYLSPGLPVFDMVEINKLKFIAKLTADETEKIQKGQTVKLNVDANPGVIYEGKVIAVIIQADLSKRYDVEIEVNNRADKLVKPGMFGTVLFTCNANASSLVIPRKAIAGSIQHPDIFLVKGDSVILRKIVALPLNDQFVMVSDGLKAGDVIVTSGQISLVNGSKIKLIN